MAATTSSASADASPPPPPTPPWTSGAASAAPAPQPIRSGGGSGGSVTATIGSMDIAGATSIRGGYVNNPGGGIAGDGGNVVVNLTSATDTTVFRSTLGIMGTNGGADPAGGAVGGKGGSVTMNNPSARIQALGAMTIQSGMGSNTAGAAPGAGGDVVFNANTLELGAATHTVLAQDRRQSADGSNVTVGITTLRSLDDAATLTITKTNNTSSGVMNFSADTVDATANSMTITVANTVTAAGLGPDRASFGEFIIGGGRTVAVTATSPNSMSIERGITVLAHDGADATNFVGKTLSFQFPRAILPATPGDTTALLNVGNALEVDNTTTVNLSMVGTDPYSLVAGDRINLVSATTGTSVYDARNVSAHGSSYSHDFIVQRDIAGTNPLFATFAGMNPSGGAMTNFLMGKTVGVALIAGGAEVVADALSNTTVMTGPGMLGSAADCYRASLSCDGVEIVGFGEFGAGRYKYRTGANVNSDDIHLLAGIGLRFCSGWGRTTLGAFFESGWGDYDVDNSAGGRGFHGDGKTRYQGGGLLLRQETDSGVYAELSGRVGRLKSEHKAAWFASGYDSRSTYFGGHLGVGYAFPIFSSGSLDTSARMLWTRVDGDAYHNSVGGYYDVKSTDSIRSQLGATYRHRITDKVQAVAGAAWEYEFDGKVKGAMDGFRIDDGKLKGHTGIARLGVEYRPSDRVAVGLSGHGSIGKKKGLGGAIDFAIGF